MQPNKLHKLYKCGLNRFTQPFNQTNSDSTKMLLLLDAEMLGDSQHGDIFCASPRRKLAADRDGARRRSRGPHPSVRPR